MARQALTNTSTGQTFRAIEWVSARYGLNEPGELRNEYTGTHFLEANSQAFKANDLVYLSATGTVTAVTDDGTGTMVMAGMALTDATNVTSGNVAIRVMKIVPGDIYSINVYSDTEGGTNPDDLEKLKGNAYNIVAMTVTETDGSTWYGAALDLDAATAARARIVAVERKPLLAVTASYCRVHVQFMPYLAASGNATNFYANCQFI